MSEKGFYNNAIFWIEVDRIRPNPYQPRREFDQVALQSLADSIRQYGVLQPLVVTRFEIEKEDGGLATGYELIAGERRWRASKIAGLMTVPALIREAEHSDKAKLELAIIENLQREDLNPIERAEAFQKLIEEFGFKHVEVAKKIGKSREYVSNSVRLLSLPNEMKEFIVQGKITEGHARPLLMLGDRPEEQSVLFKEIHIKRLTVRETEEIARRIAHDKVRKQIHDDPRILGLERELSDVLGTRVSIEKKAVGGKIMIDFFSDDDLQTLFSAINGLRSAFIDGGEVENYENDTLKESAIQEDVFAQDTYESDILEKVSEDSFSTQEDEIPEDVQETIESSEKKSKDDLEDDDLYSIQNFSV